MRDSNGEARLREAYATLMARRAVTASPPDISVEEVQSLAAGTWTGADRAARLDEVLANPETAREFHFFLDLANEQPARQPLQASSSWLKAAAVLFLGVSAVALWRATHPATPDVTRDVMETVSLIAPAGGELLEAGAIFAWHSVSGAADYQLEVIDDDGNSLVAAATIDTTYMMPANIEPIPGMTYRWWVVARRSDGSEVRATPRNISGR